MNLENIPKKYLYGTILLTVVVLIAITVLQPASFLYKDNTDYNAKRQEALKEQEEYKALLASLNPDYNASKQMLQKIATEELVKKQVDEALQVNQRIVIPTLPDSEIKPSDRTDATAISSYLNDFTSMVKNYNSNITSYVSRSFVSGASEQDALQAKNETLKLATTLRGMAVPKEAVSYHKDAIITFDSYSKFFDAAAKYAKGETDQVWPEVYNSYSVIDSKIYSANNTINELDKKFSLDLHKTERKDMAFGLVPEAQAFFGGLVVVDVQQAFEEGVKAGLARSFAAFTIKMIDKLVSHIEKNFAIASQLYYSNELGRFYSVEYMKKFVNNPMDEAIIQKFLPEYFCTPTSKEELRNIYKAKARENLGNDIVIDPNSPDFYKKLSEVATDEKNYPGWWEDYYSSLAAQTRQQAESAATKEVISPGLKSGRDIISGQVNKTMSSIFQVQESAISGTMDLGTNNTQSIVGKLVASTIESLVNKFVFTPITGEASSGGPGAVGSGLGILYEKSVCLKNPLVKPIAAIPETEYSEPDSGTPVYP